jgi:hypothetical protein
MEYKGQYHLFKLLKMFMLIFFPMSTHTNIYTNTPHTHTHTHTHTNTHTRAHIHTHTHTHTTRPTSCS